jgi:Asp-tRNA(Asn)/Glu-tRNA(Gln) amidotransferase B subunit
VESGKVRPEAFTWILDEALEHPHRTPPQILARFKPLKAEGPKIRKAIKEAVARAEAMSGRTPDTLLRWAMGEVLRQHFGRVDPLAVKSALWEALEILVEEVTP